MPSNQRRKAPQIWILLGHGEHRMPPDHDFTYETDAIPALLDDGRFVESTLRKHGLRPIVAVWRARRKLIKSSALTFDSSLPPALLHRPSESYS